MWRTPLSLFGGSGVASLTFTSDTYIGDLFAYLGSPSIAVEVTITADNADVAAIFISSSFDPASTFTFVGTNGGRFIGEGGAGGAGGDDNGATGTAGSKGGAGGAAIVSALNIDIDIDDGFLLGGGGGAGGGSYDAGSGGTPGGGGGGGIGWGDAAGGAAGDPTGTPIASAGTAGSQTAAGNGGSGGTSLTNDGGDGGGWGLAGEYGQHANPTNNPLGVNNLRGNGGSRGSGGSAFSPLSGAVATFTGAKSQATLRTENRIKGETDGNLVLGDVSISGFHVGIGHASETYGFTFETDGDLTKINSDTGNTTTSFWSGNAFTAANYEVRLTSDTKAGTWDVSAGTDNDWLPLSSGTKTWTFATAASSQNAGAIYEIRRTDETLPTAGGRLKAVVVYEP